MSTNAIEIRGLCKSYKDFSLQDLNLDLPYGCVLGLVGENGTIHGLDHFGYSAPYKVLDVQFGYNGPTVADEVKKMLGKR